MNPFEISEKIQQEKTFLDWETNHQNNFLSHFFCQINSKLEEKSEWDLGYYNKDNDKITTFTKIENRYQLKNEDEVFKKENDTVEKLSFKQIKIELSEAKKVVENNLKKIFPGEIMGDGFVILQTVNQKTTWNFTFVTKTLKLANIKINTSNGKIFSNQIIELLQKS